MVKTGFERFFLFAFALCLEIQAFRFLMPSLEIASLVNILQAL